jgi:aminobenzoyl-glutamate transport protein
LSDAAAPAADTPQHSFLERMLDGIERLENRMPHPAIMFLALCGAVIVLSQVLFWFGVKATYEVVETPTAPAEQVYYGGSTEPVFVGPSEPLPAKDYDKVVTRTTKVQGLLEEPASPT